MSVTLALEDEIDISRGDMMAAGEGDAPKASRHFEATLVWMNELPLDASRRYLLKHGAQLVPAEIRAVRHRVNIESLEGEAADTLEMNQIGVVEIDAMRPLYFDSYRANRRTGCLVAIDPRTNATVAAGMIAGAIEPPAGDGGPRERKTAILTEWHEEAVRVLREAGFEVEIAARWI